MISIRLILFVGVILCVSLPVQAQQYKWNSTRTQTDSFRASRPYQSNSSSVSYWKKNTKTILQDEIQDEPQNEGKLYLGGSGNRQQEQEDQDSPSDQFQGSVESDVDEDEEENDDLDYLEDDDPLEADSELENPLSGLNRWPRKSIFEIRIDPREYSIKAPNDDSSLLLTSYGRDWNRFAARQKFLAWDAPNIRYHPLYFEDVALERYGQVFGNDYLQTAKSGAHFFSAFLLWPLHARHDPTFSCETPLGYCRPGNNTSSINERKIWGRLPR